MANFRAAKAGFAREAQAKIDQSFNVEEGRICFQWITDMTDLEMPKLPDERVEAMVIFHNTLRDGLALCRLINTLVHDDQKFDFSRRTFQATENTSFKMARERERIGLFLTKVLVYGIDDTNTFQTDYLFEKTNLTQVCTCIRSLGIEAQTRPEYCGPMSWPKKSVTNRRMFSPEQLKAGQNIIGLQMGTNRGANQSGISFGKARMIID